MSWHTITHLTIIAGTGSLPVDAIKAAQKKHISCTVIALFPEDNGEQLQQHVTGDNFIAQQFYKIGAIKKLLIQQNTTHLLFVGKVDKRLMLKKLSFDFEYVKLATKALYKSDTALMNILVETLEKELSITVIKQTSLLDALFIPPGIISGTVTAALRKDISYGLGLAQTISEHDIGQTVVVKDTMPLAIEAIEGTDECIARGIMLGKKGVVVCKTSRYDQNKKFDIPTLGPQTLNGLDTGDVAAIAWHSDRTLITDKELFIELAQQKKIALISAPSQSNRLADILS